MVNAALFGPLSAVGALAQETSTTSTDDTGRMITLVIGALLGLALLLAVLTFWYWRRTDPRKVARSSAEPVTAAVAPSASARASTGGAAPAPKRSSARPATANATRSDTGEGTAVDRGISPDEWLRLTGSKRSTPQDRT
jgi:predicted lipid-binding transport protein (Tim44 family)